MLIVNKEAPTKEELMQWLSTDTGYLEGLSKYENNPLMLYDYQKQIISSNDILNNYLKSRQIGASFAFALRGYTRTQMCRKNYTCTFVSINKSESKEKIAYADAIHRSIPDKWKRKRKIDTKFEQEFSDSTGHITTRLLSHPQRPVRGKATDVILDELDHYFEQSLIYQSALPAISRSDYCLFNNSTPFMVGELFYNISTNDRNRYPGFKNFILPWWICPEFCNNISEGNIIKELPTIERVERYGSPKLKQLFNNMDIEDFQQEYECMFIDESSSYFPYDLIKKCADDNIKTYVSVDTLAASFDGKLLAGFDVGRTKNITVFWIVEQIGDQYIDRFVKTFDNVPLPEQQAEIEKAFRKLPITCNMDRNGIGRHMFDYFVKKYPAKITGIDFTNEDKEYMATTVHNLMEQENILKFRADREIMRQIHSIKRTKTPGGRLKFDTARNEKYHADYFWALALALTEFKVGSNFSNWNKEKLEQLTKGGGIANVGKRKRETSW